MKKTVGCIIARTFSTRLPKKVLRKLVDESLIEYIIDKSKRVKNFDSLYLCTSIDPEDKILLEIAEKKGIKGYAGSRDIVIDRMLNVAKIAKADNVVRITGDNVFSDEIFIDKMIELHNEYNADYTRTTSLPLGISAEIFSVKGLLNMYDSLDLQQTEYLTYYVFFSENSLKKLILYPPMQFQEPYYNLTVDTPADFKRTQYIFENLKEKKRIDLDDIIKLSKRVDIPNLKIHSEMKIKFPNQQTKLYKEYLEELEEQYKNCITVYLEDDFYEKYKNR